MAGLADPAVQISHRLALWQRAARIKASPSGRKLQHQLGQLQEVVVQDVRHVSGRIFWS